MNANTYWHSDQLLWHDGSSSAGIRRNPRHPPATHHLIATAGPCARAPMARPLLLLLADVVLAAAPGQAQTCSQLQTCAEAIKALQARNLDLDRDGDGISCESLREGYRPPASRGGGQSSSSPPLLIAPAVAPSAPRPRPPAVCRP